MQVSKGYKIAIIGASATSCILGIHLKSRGHKVLLFERGDKVGGAWQVDSFGSFFSNIIAPTKKSEIKNFSKIINFLKGYKIKFNKNYQKGLFTKKIVKVKSSDFREFIKISKKKLKIKYNYEVKNVKEEKNFIKINNKLKFDYIFFPKNVFVKKISLVSGRNLTIKINNKLSKVIKSKHVRFSCKNLNVDKIAFNESGVGPMDRLQIFNDKNGKKIVNGRIKLDWKKKGKNQILSAIRGSLNVKKISSLKFFHYISEKVSNKSFTKLIKNIKKSKRIKFVNTNSISEFVFDNFIKKKGFHL
tara:strand:+ start:1453 stop:2358 length:906 start_codon:yes stop_codon:yes gene_type:complete